LPEPPPQAIAQSDAVWQRPKLVESDRNPSLLQTLLEALPLMLFARLLGIIGQDRGVDIANKLRQWDLVQPRRRRPTTVIQERNFTPVGEECELTHFEGRPGSDA
jgi:hypothetical protein